MFYIFRKIPNNPSQSGLVYYWDGRIGLSEEHQESHIYILTNSTYHQRDVMETDQSSPTLL